MSRRGYSALKLVLLLHTIAADVFFAAQGALIAATGAPSVRSPLLTPEEAAAFVAVVNGLGYGLTFVTPGWRGCSALDRTRTTTTSASALVAWRAYAFCGFMVYLLPLVLQPSPQLYAWLLFYGPMVHFLLCVTTVTSATFRAHPLHTLVCLLTPYVQCLPVLLIE